MKFGTFIFTLPMMLIGVGLLIQGLRPGLLEEAFTQQPKYRIVNVERKYRAVTSLKQQTRSFTLPTIRVTGKKEGDLLPTPHPRKWGEGNILKVLPIQYRNVKNVLEMERYAVEDLVAFVASRTGVPSEYLMCLLSEESRMFRNIGRPGKGLADAHVNRDGVASYALADHFGYNASEVKSSQSAGGGYGSASGGAQVLPSNHIRLGGWKLKSKKIFSNSHKSYTKKDLVYIQRTLNRHFKRKVVTVDGMPGHQTNRWLVKYFRETLEKKHMPKDLASRVRDAGFVKTMLTVQAGYTLTYSARNDKIAATLGKSGPHNPWDPIVSLTAGALILKENKVVTRPKYAAGAYMAGPKNAFGGYGKEYAERFYSYFVWAQARMRAYYKAYRWKTS